MANALPRLLLAVSVVDAEAVAPMADAAPAPAAALNRLCALVPEADPAAPRTPRCVPYPGRAYRFTPRALTGPIGEPIEPSFGPLLADALSTVALVFPANDPDPLFVTAHLVQGLVSRADGALEGQAGRSRAFALGGRLDSVAPEGGGVADAPDIWGLYPAAPAPEPTRLRVSQTTAEGGTCTVPLLAVLRLDVVGPVEGLGEAMYLSASTCLSGRDAARVALPDGTHLDAALEQISEPICDSNRDDLPDGWPVRLEADLTPVEFVGEPAAFVGASVDTPDCP